MYAYDVEPDQYDAPPRRRRPRPRSASGSGWKVVLIVGGVLAAGLVALIVGVVLLVVLVGEGRGTKIPLKNGCELYYTKAVSEPEARRLADYMEGDKSPLNGSENKGSFQINKVGERYELRAVVKPEAVHDPRVQFGFRLWAAMISVDVFGGAPVDVHLCDENLKTMEVLRFDGK